MKKPARRSSRRQKCRGGPQRQKRRALSTHERLTVHGFGEAVRLDYRRGKKLYTHPFTGAKVYASIDERALIIAPVKIRNGQIH